MSAQDRTGWRKVSAVCYPLTGNSQVRSIPLLYCHAVVLSEYYVVTNLHLVIVFVACRKGGLKRVAPGADELVKYSFV